MTGMHRAPSQQKFRTVLSYIFTFVILATLVAIVVTQINWHSSKKNVAAPNHISVSHAADPSFVTPFSIAASTPTSSAPVTITTPPVAISTTPAPPTTSTPTVTAPPDTTAPVTTTAPATPVYQKIYIVRPGDTLTGISDFFKDNGYGSIYMWNKALIGSNPNLIFPGQALIVSQGSPPPVVVNP